MGGCSPFRVLKGGTIEKPQRGLWLSIGGELNQFVTHVFNGRCSRTRKGKEMWGRGVLKRQPHRYDWPLAGAHLNAVLVLTKQKDKQN